MAKTWNVVVDGNPYNIELAKGTKVIVNGEELKLKDYKKKSGLVHTEYEIPVGSKQALLVIMTAKSPQLVIDNRDCETGEEFVPIKIPGWAYIFVVLHFINFLNGAIGAAMAVVGVALTTSVSINRKMNIAVKVLLNVAIVVVAYIVVFGVALLAAGLL